MTFNVPINMVYNYNKNICFKYYLAFCFLFTSTLWSFSTLIVTDTTQAQREKYAWFRCTPSNGELLSGDSNIIKIKDQSLSFKTTVN